MGDYVNPPTKVQSGRPISPGNFQQMAAQLRPGEVLVGLYDRLIFKLAPIIPDASELEAFESQYRAGHLVSRAFFAMKVEEVA